MLFTPEYFLSELYLCLNFLFYVQNLLLPKYPDIFCHYLFIYLLVPILLFFRILFVPKLLPPKILFVPIYLFTEPQLCLDIICRMLFVPKYCLTKFCLCLHIVYVYCICV